MAAFDDEIQAYYDRGEERDRLATISRLEGLRTRELIERFLPPPPATVLDVGGGAGAYALWLADMGYEVHLVDPVALHIEQARAAGGRLASAAVGDARALDQPDASADALLLLGPLYHLTDADDRARALAEARRLLRPGGPLLAAAISRFAAALDGLVHRFLLEPGFESIVERDLRDGQHRNPTRHPRWFTTAYFHRPEDLEREVAAAGFGDVEVLAVEGPGDVVSYLEDDWLDDPEKREILLRTLGRIESEPSLLGASPHLLAVGRA